MQVFLEDRYLTHLLDVVHFILFPYAIRDSSLRTFQSTVPVGISRAKKEDGDQLDEFHSFSSTEID